MWGWTDSSAIDLHREIKGRGTWGGKIMSLVLERSSLRKWRDIQIDMSVSKLVICEETEGVS